MNYEYIKGPLNYTGGKYSILKDIMKDVKPENEGEE